MTFFVGVGPHPRNNRLDFWWRSGSRLLDLDRDLDPGLFKVFFFEPLLNVLLELPVYFHDVNS